MPVLWLFYYIYIIRISIIIFAVLILLKRKNVLWSLLFSFGLAPFILLLIQAIYATFNGTGLVGDSGGLSSGLFAIVLFFIFQWYIYIPAFVLLVVSFYKLFIKKPKE